MQFKFENPYTSPLELVESRATSQPQVSLQRGFYYAALWGLVVFPAPFIWLGMHALFRPDLPPPSLAEFTLQNALSAILRLFILPFFFGLIAIANYTPPQFVGYIRTFVYFVLAYFLHVSALVAISEFFDGPLNLVRTYQGPTPLQEFWNGCWVLSGPIAFTFYLTWWRIKHPPIPMAMLIEDGK